VPFFANADTNFVSDVVTKLRYEVFQPGKDPDIICHNIQLLILLNDDDENNTWHCSVWLIY
jgi:hypothetical protein